VTALGGKHRQEESEGVLSKRKSDNYVEGLSPELRGWEPRQEGSVLATKSIITIRSSVKQYVEVLACRTVHIFARPLVAEEGKSIQSTK
jgi:hypothetical protein